MSQQHGKTADTVNNLIEQLSGLPGIGPKSAQRLTYYLLRSPEEQLKKIGQAILCLKQNTRQCSRCFNVADSELCPICQNGQRTRDKICVVEQPQDILALEHSGVYNGLYHVLHGAIAPTEGIGTDDLKINELLSRLKEGSVAEVIIATNPTTEGETTTMYLQRLITPLGIKVTRLAQGLPFGTEIEYADDVTLSRALKGRQEL